MTLPPGFTRDDVVVVEEAMEPTRGGVDVNVILYTKKFKRLKEVHGKSFYLSGRYFVVVVDGVPEMIGLKMQKNTRGVNSPYFFIVDDPSLKRRLLDADETKLMQAYGIDYRVLRKKLLDDENAGP